MHHIFIILHNIRSSENVGSIMRTADAAAASKIYMTGYTPAPLDRFKRKNTKLAKAALGAEQTVPWEKQEDVYALIQELKESGISVVAVEQVPQAVSYMILEHRGDTAFIFGNEVEGVPQQIIDMADTAIEIPMHGKKESLNVAVAAGIVLYHARSNGS